MTKLRIAAFQRAPVFDDASLILALLIKDLVWCAENDVRLAVFPECYLQGYATDVDTISRRAVEIQGDLVARLRHLTKDFPTDIVMGFVEKHGQQFFNTALAVRDGVLLGAYSKSHPNEPAFEAGNEYPVFDLSGYRYGINICNDANYPSSALALSTQGADLCAIH
jgi:predicted amidohydrolase